jgi:hypothetical protein
MRMNDDSGFRRQEFIAACDDAFITREYAALYNQFQNCLI